MISLYQQALDIVTTAPHETQIPKPANLPAFRKYLSVLAAAKNKKFTTKVVGGKLLIKQYYEL